jgi:glutamyl-tRNA reductase
MIEQYWIKLNKIEHKNFYLKIERSYDYKAIKHLFRLASGLESVILGEDQILGQVKKAFKEAKKTGTVNNLSQLLFSKAIATGKKVRINTKINNGSVSIGSIVNNLLQKSYITLKNKEIIIIGAGEIGILVGKALSSCNHTVIFVSNKTYERGVRLAKDLKGYAVRFDDIEELLTQVDIAVVATSAPHYVLKEKMLERIMKKRGYRKLVIIDLGQPRNVEESSSNIKNIELKSLKDVNHIAQANLSHRKKDVDKAESIINENIKVLWNFIQYHKTHSFISEIYNNLEEIRKTEVEKAFEMLGELNDDQRQIIQNLTQVITKRIIHHPIVNLRKALASNDSQVISIAEKLFKTEH